jgi:hypothetical protein
MKHLSHSKLPFNIDEDSKNVDIVDNELVIVGAITYSNDAEYLCEAANNYQEAIKLLQFANRELSEFYDKTESDTLSKIKEFLKKVE